MINNARIVFVDAVSKVSSARRLIHRDRVTKHSERARRQSVPFYRLLALRTAAMTQKYRCWAGVSTDDGAEHAALPSGLKMRGGGRETKLGPDVPLLSVRRFEVSVLNIAPRCFLERERSGRAASHTVGVSREHGWRNTVEVTANGRWLRTGERDGGGGRRVACD